MRRVVLVLAAGTLLAGCGGGSGKPASFTLQATKQCMKQNLGVTTFPSIAHDFVASTASGGAMRVQLKDNEVTLVFGVDEEEAGNLADAYRRFHAENVGVEDVLRTNKNVVLLWQEHASSGDETNVNGCLK